MTTTGTWRKGDRLTARWAQRVSNFIENFTVSGGAFEFDGRTPRLYVSASSQSKQSFGYKATQGGGGTEGTVTIYAGTIQLADKDGNAYYECAQATTGAGGLTALADGFNVLYVDWLLKTSAAIGIASGATHIAALNAADSSAANLVCVLHAVEYDSTTKQITYTRDHRYDVAILPQFPM